MALNKKCPKCGSEKAQLSNVRSKRGCLFTILSAFIMFWVMIKWCIGFTILICYDWWMAIIKAATKKGYVWQSMRWFSNSRKIYYCPDCGHNFRA